MRYGFELQFGFPWSGYMYQPDFSSMWLIKEVPPEVLVWMAAVSSLGPDDEALEVVAVLMAITGAETSTEREAVS